jgi:hypothetical protein
MSGEPRAPWTAPSRVTAREELGSLKVGIAVVCAVAAVIVVVVLLLQNHTGTVATTTESTNDPGRYELICTDSLAAEGDLGMNGATRAAPATLAQDGNQLYADAKLLGGSELVAREATSVSKDLTGAGGSGSAKDLTDAEATLTTIIDFCHSTGWSG